MHRRREENFGCFWLGLCSLLILLGLFWLISGEIAIPNKGIFLVGASARVAASLWIGVNAYLIWTAIREKRRHQQDSDANVSGRREGK